MERSQIEARARAHARARDESARLGPLRDEVAALERGAGPMRRAAAALAGSRLAGLLAGYGAAGRHDRGKTDAQRRADALRRRRFRLSRRRRVLEGGARRWRASADGYAAAAPSSVSDEPPPGRLWRGHPGALGFCIRIGARDWEAAERGGDLALARSLARALAARGHGARLQVAAEAGQELPRDVDVVLALRGRAVGEPAPGRFNLLWLLSHPEEADVEELNRYDRVLVASTRHAEALDGRLDVPVEPLLQFTDPALFHPEPQAATAHELLFVGNWRGEFRRIVWDAIRAGHPPALYGEGWDLLAPEHAVAERVPHADLHRLYSSCGILLCDHWEDMRRAGFVSNRVFDALACGAFVIADDNPGLAEALPGAVETYSDAAELGAKIERYLGDPETREQLARRGREAVLTEHTVEHRVDRLLTAVRASADLAGRAGANSTR